MLFINPSMLHKFEKFRLILNKIIIYNKHNSNFISILSILAIALIVRLFFLFRLDLSAISGDQWFVISRANEWLLDPWTIHGGLRYLPLHYLLMALISKTGVEVFIAGLFISFISGFLSIYFIFKVVEKLFNKENAFLTCLIIALNPLHVNLSLIAIGDIFFIFLLFTGIFFLLKFLTTNHLAFLIISSFFLNSASVVRFEGWYFSFFLTLILLYYNRNLNIFFLYGFVNILPIATHIIISYKYHGEPFFAITAGSSQVYIDHLANNVTFNTRLKYFLSIPGSWYFFLLPLGTIVSIFKKINIPYLLMGVFLFLILSYKLLTGGLELFHKYFLPPIIILLPFLLTSFGKHLQKTYIFFSLSLLIAILSFTDLKKIYIDMERKINVNQEIIFSAKWIKSNSDKDDEILIDVGLGLAPFWIFHAGRTKVFGGKTTFPNMPFIKNQDYRDEIVSSDEYITAYLNPFAKNNFLNFYNRKKFRFFVIKSGERIHTYLDNDIIKSFFVKNNIELKTKVVLSNIKIIELIKK